MKKHLQHKPNLNTRTVLWLSCDALDKLPNKLTIFCTMLHYGINKWWSILTMTFSKIRNHFASDSINIPQHTFSARNILERFLRSEQSDFTPLRWQENIRHITDIITYILPFSKVFYIEFNKTPIFHDWPLNWNFATLIQEMFQQVSRLAYRKAVLCRQCR